MWVVLFLLTTAWEVEVWKRALYWTIVAMDLFNVGEIGGRREAFVRRSEVLALRV